MSYLAKRSGLSARSRMTITAAVVAGVIAACGGSNTNNQGLWVANGTNVLEYTPTQLMGASGATAPHVTINSGAMGAPQGVTFDKMGNLYVMDPNAMVNGTTEAAILKFTPAQLTALKTNNKPDPAAIITAEGMKFPQQSVFDKQGNQWIADHDGNQILVFNAAQLAMTGINKLMPVVTITSASFNGPLGITFDAAGNLWVANNGGVAGANNTMSPAGTTIVEFTAAHLPMVPATGMLTPMLNPDLTISDNGHGTLSSPWALVFDTAGNLWANNAGAPFTIVEFAKANLTMGGMLTPAVTISPTMVNGTATLNGPNGLCFDPAGNLANTDAEGAFGLDFFKKAQLMTGATVPATFIYGTATTLDAPAGCNFGTLIN